MHNEYIHAEMAQTTEDHPEDYNSSLSNLNLGVTVRGCCFTFFLNGLEFLDTFFFSGLF